MKIRCRANRGSDLGPFKRGLFYSRETRFSSLRVGELFDVYGISLVRAAPPGVTLGQSGDEVVPEPGLAVLVAHQYDTPPTLRPDWYPIELFTVEDARLPDDWEFSMVSEFVPSSEHSGNVLARWGYRLLVSSDDHFDGLAERRTRALEEFRQEFDRRNRMSGDGGHTPQDEARI
jgi:hypothetical protein